MHLLLFKKVIYSSIRTTMKKKTIAFIIVLRLILPQVALTDEPACPTGEAAAQGRVSAASMTWAIVGIGLLVAVGIVIAVTIANDK